MVIKVLGNVRMFFRVLIWVSGRMGMGRSVFGEVEGCDELIWVYVECLIYICVFYYLINVVG